MCTLFKYDVVTLIELVESRPCLWDKTADCFKDKIEKQKAWREVYVVLEKEFDKDKKEQLFATRSTRKSKVCRPTFMRK